MSLIGQLMVELGINTAAFKTGLDKATYQAQQFAKEVKGSFSAVGDSVSELVGAFGAIDPAVGALVSGISGALEPLLGSLGTVGGAVAGVGAALAAAGVGAIGIAVSFSETAARIGELSQATGVAVEDLSLLGDIAATKGIGLDQMAKALEKLDKAALAAAQSGPKSQNAFRDLGIAVTEADGSMRSAKDIFDSVAAKFATMPDGPQKTAEAIKLFGRAGAEMIPLLNEGGAKLGELQAHFEALNAVVSGPTAAASEQLKENMSLMKAAFTGIENQLTADLVPALNEVAQEFIAAFEGDENNIKGFVDAIADVAKVILNLVQLIGLLAKIIVDAVGAGIEAFQQLGEVIKLVSGSIVSAAHGDFKGAWEGVKDAGVGTWNRIKDNAMVAVNDIENSVKGMSNVWTASLPAAKKSSGTAGAPNAGADTSFIDKQVDALERQAKKEQELAAAIGVATGSQIDANAAAIASDAIEKLRDEAAQKGIENTLAFKNALDAAIPRIQAAAQWQAAFKAAISDQGEFDKFTKKITEQVAALQGEAAAGTVVERTWAKNNATLKPLADTLQQLGLKYEELRQQYGDNDSRVQALAAKVASLNAQYKEEVKNVNDLNKAEAENAGRAKLQEETAKLATMQATTAALLQGGEAYAKIEEQVTAYATKTGAAKDKVEEFRQTLIAENAELQKQAAQKLADPGNSEQSNNLKIQIAYLQTLDEQWKAQGKAIGGVEAELANVNAQYADLQAKSGAYDKQITAAFADFNAEVKKSNQSLVKDLIGQGLNGVSQAFSDMVVKGKADWQGLVDSMESALLQSAIKNILNSLLGSITKALGGGDSGGGIFGGLFGGGHADGGDVTPGKTYLVGEKGPELLKVGAAGSSIIPNGQFGGGGGGSVTVVQNITTPDADSFKRSAPQVHAQAYRSAASTYSRMRQ